MTSHLQGEGNQQLCDYLQNLNYEIWGGLENIKLCLMSFMDDP